MDDQKASVDNLEDLLEDPEDLEAQKVSVGDLEDLGVSVDDPKASVVEEDDQPHTEQERAQ